MVDISIVDGGYKLTYNWGVPHCREIMVRGGIPTPLKNDGLRQLG